MCLCFTLFVALVTLQGLKNMWSSKISSFVPICKIEYIMWFCRSAGKRLAAFHTHLKTTIPASAGGVCNSPSLICPSERFSDQMSRISEEDLVCQSQYFFPIIPLAQGFENPHQEPLVAGSAVEVLLDRFSWLLN